MKFDVLARLAALALMASPCLASPIVASAPVVSPPIDLTRKQAGAVDPIILIRQGLDAVKDRPDNSIFKKESFPLDRTWKNEVLFEGGFEGATGFVNLAVTCIDCYTKGSVGVEIWDNLFEPDLEFTFTGAEAYVLMGVNITANEQVAISLFTSQTPIGVGIPGIRAGVFFSIDLIISLTANMDLSGGFWVDFPEHASMELGIFDGKLDASSFDGTRTGLVPVTVRTASGRFQADLRISIQAGVEADNKLFGIGAGALFGVYANVVELIATFEQTPTCQLEVEAEYNFNVGAFAQMSVDLGPTVIGITPTASTTLLRAPIISTCLLSGSLPALPATSAIFTSNFVTFESSTATGTQSLATASSTSLITTKQPSILASATPAPTLSSQQSLSSPSISQTLPVITASPSVAAGERGCGANGRLQTYTVVRCALNAVNCPEGYGEEIVATGLAPSSGRRHVAKVRAEALAPHALTGGVVMTKLSTPIVHTVLA